MNEEIHMRMEREDGMPEQCPMMGVGFFIRPVQNPERSKAAGHPVFEDREWVKIVTPGDKNSWVERKATDIEKRRFPKTYAAFKTMEHQQAVNGFRIEEWPQVTRAMAMTLKAAHIDTVEALAQVSDGHIDKIGHSGRDLRAKAQAFLVVSKDTAAAQNFKAESDKKDATLLDMQRQINELAAQLQKRGPGRPPKFETGPLETRIA